MVTVVVEFGEIAYVIPHSHVRCVEEMRPVAVNLDACLRLEIRVRIAPYVIATIQDHHLVTLGCSPLGNRQTEES